MSHPDIRAYAGATFTLTRDQKTRAELWYHDHSLWCGGANHLAMSFRFTDNGIGWAQHAECQWCGERFDLTDYSSW